MQHPLYLSNTLSRKKEAFIPLHPPRVGMYVCGPTVYGEPHLGHARCYVTFDLLFRYLQHLGYRVRYVRNITDVGHLTGDTDEGEDKILKKARLDQLEPMEVVQHYSNTFHQAMRALNVLNPSIEPSASGHIPEQIALIQEILAQRMAYEVDGSVYFDVPGFDKKYGYGKLSGRRIDELMSGAGNERRTLQGSEEKRSPLDFALWKKAGKEHLMQWESPWGKGFPGWHLECSAMSRKYLGLEFDIHGGGMDLIFPHHECEIAQSKGAQGQEPVRYWLHNNMITINGQKMGKSLGNSIDLSQLFSGDHDLLVQGYDPMTVRFFIMQAHYRSTLDFSNEALQAAGKGLVKLRKAWEQIKSWKGKENEAPNANALLAVHPPWTSPALDQNQVWENPQGPVQTWLKDCYQAMNDDLNSPILIAQLFQAVSWVQEPDKLNAQDKAMLGTYFPYFFAHILGLSGTQDGRSSGDDKTLSQDLMELILDLRKGARDQKDFATSDKIRDSLLRMGIQVKDGKEGATWEKID